MRTENAYWNPRAQKTPGRIPSDSVKVVRSLRTGETKRIIHDEVYCTIGIKGYNHPACSLGSEIGRLRRIHGWNIEYYHEQPGVLVVKRNK